MNKYFATSDLAEAGSAIQSYYAGGVAIHWSSGSNLVISGSALTDKYVRFYISSTRLFGQYSGSIGASGSGLISPVTFVVSTSAGTSSSTNWVLCPNMIFFCQLLTNVVAKTGFIGRLNSGQYIVACGAQNTTYIDNARCINTTTGLDVFMQPILYQGYKTAANKYFKMRPFFCCAVNGISTVSGSPAYIPDLQLSTVNMPNNAVYSGSGVFMSAGGTLYLNNTYETGPTTDFTKCPFLIENVEPL